MGRRFPTCRHCKGIRFKLSRAAKHVGEIDHLEAALGRLSARTVVEPIPAPRTESEHDLFDVLTVLFLAPLAPGHVRESVRTTVGETNLEFLLGFMGFIRAAHYW